MNNIYLVYENSGQAEIFEVEPRYIKNEKFSAKILEQNRSRSFAFSMMLGLFEDYAEAKALLVKLKKNNSKSLQIDKLNKEEDKFNDKVERLQDQHDRLDERTMKKGEVIDNLEERAGIEGLTAKQAERLAKTTLDYSALEEKMEELDGKIEALGKLIDSNLEEVGRLQDEDARFLNELQTKCLFKLHSLSIEDRTEAQVEVEIVETPKIPEQAPILPPPITTERVQTNIPHSSPLRSESTFLKKVLSIFTRKK